ncbi:hypothetical protein [Planococcus donghaensis]|uniref:hypothetical protein n=1 Tax=Planococcus donghaensis TaxID=414778 RepID=UPI000AC14296|nr:hypothetical protein [Planococcus donghaensis]
MFYIPLTLALVFIAMLLINFIVGFLLLNIRDKNYWVISTVTSLVFTLIFVVVL